MKVLPILELVELQKKLAHRHVQRLEVQLLNKVWTWLRRSGENKDNFHQILVWTPLSITWNVIWIKEILARWKDSTAPLHYGWNRPDKNTHGSKLINGIGPRYKDQIFGLSIPSINYDLDNRFSILSQSLLNCFFRVTVVWENLKEGRSGGRLGHGFKSKLSSVKKGEGGIWIHATEGGFKSRRGRSTYFLSIICLQGKWGVPFALL